MLRRFVIAGKYSENTNIKSGPRFERRLSIVHVTFNNKMQGFGSFRK